MSGCFGNHPVDKWMESQVDKYCDGADDVIICKDCGKEGSLDNDTDWVMLGDDFFCPVCSNIEDTI